MSSGARRRPSDGDGLRRRARDAMPGGVSSPVRAFEAVDGSAFFAASGDGPYLRDVEGNRYLDYVLSWGPLILGHAHPEVVDAVHRAAGRGVSFGTSVPAEVELAELVRSWFPAVEMLRFVNSGTEATMSAVRLARGVTGRDLIVKFDGCYHGHGDSFLVEAGSGVATFGLPDSPGVPAPLSELTVTVPFNDPRAVREAFDRHGGRIAAVIVEPVVGNAGLILPEDGFLEGLREVTRAHDSLLIFDEVMTGFRVSRGGAQERFGVEPDLTTLGKVLGGGLPVGAFGGKRRWMREVAPDGPVYQAGTLSGNPLAMSAGLAQLRVLQREDPFSALADRAERLARGTVDRARERGIPAAGGAAGSMWGVHFTEGPVRSFEDARRADLSFFARYHRECMRRGVFLAPSAFEAGFVSTAHGDEEIERTLAAIGDALDAAREGE